MELRQRSIDLIKRAQDPSGAYPAALGYPVYMYCWVRDGSFIAYAMDLVGEQESARAFHRWVARAVLRYRSKVNSLQRQVPLQLGSSDTLHARFTLQGKEANEPWENFQLDGYGFWLTSLAEHLQRSGDGLSSELADAADLVVRYLGLLWDRPCYDCWEEHPEQQHPTTLAAVAEGLSRAARFVDRPEAARVANDIVGTILRRGTAEGALTKFLDSAIRDGSSLFVLGPFGPFGERHPVVRLTVEAVERTLVAEAGGVYRYLEDSFYGGGLWVPLAGALAWVWARLRDPGRAREILRWIEDCADASGRLPEQVSRRLLHPHHYQPWVERWGPVARPLLWSHAMYLIAMEGVRDQAAP